VPSSEQDLYQQYESSLGKKKRMLTETFMKTTRMQLFLDMLLPKLA